jgi:Outer membrane protein beta-barrel domain
MLLKKKLYKYTCLALVLVQCAMTPISAQEKKTNLLSHLYFPFDFGIILSNTSNINHALLTKMGLEYRIKVQKGVFIRANWDNHTHAYSIGDNTTTNVVKDKFKINEWILGVGFRKRKDKLGVLALIQGGFSNIGYNIVVPDNANYTISENSFSTVSGKFLLGFEYYLNTTFAFTFDANYSVIPTKPVFGGNQPALLGFSLGITTSFL